MKRPHIIVVGAGIIGSSITWYLSKNGARVTLLDKLLGAGLETTHKSFSWVGIGASSPLDNLDIFEYRRAALQEYRYLREELGQAFPCVTKGSIIWKSSSDKTASFIQAHNNAGSNIELISKSKLHILEPAMKNLPEIAALSPNDFSFDSTELSNILLCFAKECGATTSFNTNVLSIETNANGVIGIKTETEFLKADVIVLANGASVNSLTEHIGLQVPLQYTPSVLLKFKVNERLVEHILTSPHLEIRQENSEILLVAENLPIEGVTGLTKLTNNVESLIRHYYHIKGKIEFHSIDIGNKPYPVGGWPAIGFSKNVSGLYVAIGHPGIMLAPFIGKTAATDILNNYLNCS